MLTTHCDMRTRMRMSIATQLAQAYLGDLLQRCNHNVNQHIDHAEESHPLPFSPCRAQNRATA